MDRKFRESDESWKRVRGNSMIIWLGETCNHHGERINGNNGTGFYIVVGSRRRPNGERFETRNLPVRSFASYDV